MHPISGPTLIPRPLRFELRRDVVLRELERLRDVPLVALLAPSGYGKTTVLAQYARQVPGPVAWVQLDEEAVDLHRVTTAVLEALVCAAPDLAEALQDLPAGPEVPDPRNLARRLNASGESVTLVLDRANSLSEDGGRWLTRLVEELREGHQVLLSGYPALTLPMSRLVARGQASIIDQELLAFSVDEARQLLDTTPEDALSLYDQCSGWPIALALHRQRGRSGFGTAHLIAEVVADLPEPLRQVLPDLAPCHLWSESFVSASGTVMPPGWLDLLQRGGLPLTPLSEDTFVPHRQLLKWLRRQLEANPQRARQRYLRVAEVYQASGQPLHAIRTLLDAGEGDQAERLAASWIQGPWSRAEFQSVLSVLSEFPALHSPMLRSAGAYALIEVGRCDEARVQLTGLPDSVGFRRECGLALLYAREGQYARVMAHLQAALTYEHGAEEALFQRGLQVMALVSTDRRAEAEALVGSGPGDPDAPDVRSAMDRRYLWMQVLPLERHVDYVAGAEAMLRDLQRGRSAPALLWRALPDLLTASLLTPGLQPGTLQTDPQHPGSVTELQPLLNAPGRVEAQEWGAAAANVLRAVGELALTLGRLDEAREAFESSWQRSDQLGFDLGRNQAAGRLADLHHLRGEHEEARAQTARMSSSDHPKDRVLRLFLTGTDHLVRGDRPAALAALTQAAEVDVFSLYRWRALALLRALHLQEPGLGPPLACPEPPALPWLTALTERLRTAALEPKGASLSPLPDRSAEPGGVRMQVRTLRRLEVTIDGHTVHFPFAKAAELFAYLLLHGPSTREQIVDALWNGSNDPRHMDYFRVAVRRLRLALAEVCTSVANPVLLSAGHYALSEDYLITTDDGVVRRATEQPTQGHLHLAWTAYEGDYLPTLDSAWAEHWRTELREQLVQASLTYAVRETRDAAQEAVFAYRQVLRIDGMNEAAHEGLIRLHLDAGERQLAGQLYLRYTRIMRDEYGVSPSSSLQRLFS